MSVEHVNREPVERRVERLQEEYGEVPVEDVEAEIPADEFAEAREVARDGYTGGGYAWVVR